MFNIHANISRSDTFGTLAKLLKLSEAIAEQGFLPNFPILTYGSEVEYDGSAHNIIITMMEAHLDSLEADKRHKSGFKVMDKAFTYEKAIETLTDDRDALIGVIATRVADGNRRALACVLACAIGFPVEPVSIRTESEDVDFINIRSNLAHEDALKLANMDKLKATVALVNNGTLKTESDASRLFGTRYQGQTHWGRSQLIVLGYCDESTAVTIDKETARKVLGCRPGSAEAAELLTVKAKPGPILGRKVWEQALEACNPSMRQLVESVLANDAVSFARLVRTMELVAEAKADPSDHPAAQV